MRSISVEADQYRTDSNDVLLIFPPSNLYLETRKNEAGQGTTIKKMWIFR